MNGFRNANSLVLEGIITTLPAHDAAPSLANISPMGPIIDASMSRFVLRPFDTSTTCRNLKATGQGVFHVVDDVLLLARSAIRAMTPADGVDVRRAQQVSGVVLADACRHYELQVESIDESDERARIEVRVVHVGRHRDFFGFNRAKHAVVEAAILATRVHLTGSAHVLAEYDCLATPIEKTGGDAERQALAELTVYVRDHR